MKKSTQLIIVIIAVVIILFGIKWTRYHSIRSDQNLYQVVLLENDQAFYGKLHNIYSKYPYLTDVYYLNPQAPKIDDKGRRIGGNKFTVIKRGIDEIHQPTDALYLSKENLLYWENVGASSLVAKGIAADKDYRKKLAEKAQEEKKGK